MAEKDKEINELRRENDQLKKANSALSYTYMRLVSEYSKMLQAIEHHSEVIKSIIDGLNRPNDARNTDSR